MCALGCAIFHCFADQRSIMQQLHAARTRKKKSDRSSMCSSQTDPGTTCPSDNDNDNDTLREVRHPSMTAWPYRQECRGPDPAKKEFVSLVKLALLARCAQTHC